MKQAIEELQKKIKQKLEDKKNLEKAILIIESWLNKKK